MKFLLRLLALPIALILLLLTILVAGANGYIDTPIKYAVIYLGKLNGYEVKIDGFKIKSGLIKVNKIVIRKDNNHFLLKEVLVEPQVTIDAQHLTILAKAEEVAILGNSYQALFQGKLAKLFYSGFFAEHTSELEVLINNLQEQDAQLPHRLKNAVLNIFLKQNKSQQDIKLNFDIPEDRLLQFSGKFSNDLALTATGKNFPVTVYRLLYPLMPQHALMVFLNDFIKSGVVEEANFNINLSEEDLKKSAFNEKNIRGFAKINQMTLSYNPQLPPLTNMKVDIDLKGNITEFNIISANSTDMTIRDGFVYMDWQGAQNTILQVSAKATGPVKSLTDFIAQTTIKSLQSAAIDLTKFTGNATLDIKAQIPLISDKNSYDIKAEIPKTSLGIFANGLNLQKAKITGTFNGDKLFLDGKGYINGFESKLKFEQNFTDVSEFDHQLLITILAEKKAASEKENCQNLNFVSMLSGKAQIDFAYIYSNNQGRISLTSDLKKGEFFLDKFGIRKKAYEKAELKLEGIFQSPSQGKLKLKVTGENNLNILGDITIQDKIIDLDLEKIRHRKTNFASKIVHKEDFTDIRIGGELIDLSESNMLQFLAKENDSNAIKIQADVKKILLKNNVWAENLKAKISCDRTKCTQGLASLTVGDKPLEIKLLSNKQNPETWHIVALDAGSVLKGLGAYNYMRNGKMDVTVQTMRKEVKPGAIVPIINGKFNFEKFTLYKAPTLAKLISFVSLPGFVNFISGNDHIAFAKMEGDFNFANCILNLERSYATGAFFSFTMEGSIDTAQHKVHLKGHVNPALYGFSSIVGAIPILGKIVVGGNGQRGLTSAPYTIKDNY